MNKAEKELRDYLARTLEILKAQRNEIERLSLEVAAISGALPENYGFDSRLEVEKEQLRLMKRPLSLAGPEVYDELIRQVKAL